MLARTVSVLESITVTIWESPSTKNTWPLLESTMTPSASFLAGIRLITLSVLGSNTIAWPASPSSV